MKALQIPQPRLVRVIDLPEPAAGPGEILLRLHYVGFCGSDLNTFRGRNAMAKPDVIPGHEIGAVIAATGPGVPERFRPGQVVTVNPYTNCGGCASCRAGRYNACENNETLGVQRDGAMREYIALPWQKIIPADGIDRPGRRDPCGPARRHRDRRRPGPGETRPGARAGGRLHLQYRGRMARPPRPQRCRRGRRRARHLPARHRAGGLLRARGLHRLRQGRRGTAHFAHRQEGTRRARLAQRHPVRLRGRHPGRPPTVKPGEAQAALERWDAAPGKVFRILTQWNTEN